MSAVTCRLDTIADDLHAAAPADLGGGGAQARLVASLGKVRRTIDLAGEPGSRRARRKLKKAGQQLQAFINSVNRGTKRGKIASGIGGRVLTRAGDAKAKMLPLQRL